MSGFLFSMVEKISYIPTIEMENYFVALQLARFL